MTDKEKISPTINFEILDALSSKNINQLTSIINSTKQVANNMPFEATVQNLAICEYFLTKNINVYLQKLDKREISQETLVETAEKGDADGKSLEALYVLINYVFFKKINRKSAAFAEDRLETLNLDIEKVCFADTKFKRMCSFPYLKLFLSQVNQMFNFGYQTDFLRNLHNIKKLQLAVKAFNKEEQKNKTWGDNLIYVSPIYGSFFYNLSASPQNNFNKAELDVLTFIVNIQKAIMLNDVFNFDNNLNKLKERQLELAKSHIVDMEKVHFRAITDKDKKPYVEDETKGYEKGLFDKLIRHINCTIEFFEIYKVLFYDNNPEKALELIMTSKMTKDTGFRTMYSLAMQNMLAIVNFKVGNIHTANLCLSKALSELQIVGPKQYKKEPNILQLSRANNQIQQNAVHYNLGLSFVKCGRYEEAIAILNPLLLHFKNSHEYWYHTGICYYNLVLKELKATGQKADGEYKAVLDNYKTKYGYTAMKVRFSNCDNVLDRYELELKAKNDDKKEVKLSNLENALVCFSNALLLLEKNHNADKVTKEFAELKKKKIEVTANFKTDFSKEIDRYRTSTLELLVFLNLIAKQYLRANEYVNKALEDKSLPELSMQKLMIYKTQIDRKLGFNAAACKAFDGPVFKKLNEANEVECFIANCSKNFVKRDMADVVAFNKAVAKFKTKGEAINKEFDSMYENYLKERATGKSLECTKQLLWAHYMYNSYNLQKVRELSIAESEKTVLNHSTEYRV